MRRIISFMLAVLILSVAVLTGCASENEAEDTEGAAFTEELSSPTNASASKDIKGDIIFYPAFEDGYKTCNNEKFDFWFDVPVEWSVTDRSEDGSEYYILPKDSKIDMRIYGEMIDENVPADEYYKTLAGKDGIISDYVYRDSWMGKKIEVSANETYYVRIDGDSYLILHVNAANDPEWKRQNGDIIDYVAMSARTTRESLGTMPDEVSSITPDDLKLGDIEAGITYEKLLEIMGQEPVDVAEEAYEGMITKMVYFPDDTQVYVVNDIVFTVNVTDPGYTTPRGLKTGDSEERILELYGEPNTKSDGIWGYNIDGYELLTLVVTDGIVTQIQIEHGVWDIEVF